MTYANSKMGHRKFLKQVIKNPKKTPRDINVPNNIQKTELKYL